MTFDPTLPPPPLKGTPRMIYRAYPVRLRWWTAYQRILRRTTGPVPAKKMAVIADIDWLFRTAGADSEFWTTEVAPDMSFETVVKLLGEWHAKKCFPRGSEEGEVTPE